MERIVTHKTAPARPGSPPANYEIDHVVEGSIMRHAPTGLTIVIKKPGGTAELRAAHGALKLLVKYAGRHDDRSIVR